MAKSTLFLTTEDPYALYGPGEKIRGTANLENASPTLVRYLIVSLLAGCRITTTNVMSAKETFFHKQFRVLFHNRQDNPARALSAGQHKWDFEFTMPSSNELPPSFFYRDQDGSVEILYCLAVCEYKSNSTGPTKENMNTLTIKYSPKRSQSTIFDTSLSQLCQSLSVERYGDEPGFRRHKLPMRIPRILKRTLCRYQPVQECFHVTIWIPRFAAFTDYIEISLRIQAENEDPLRVIDVRLTKVEYRLWATTRIAYNEARRTRRHKIQTNTFTCNNLPALNSYSVPLSRRAMFRVQPKTHCILLDKTSFSTIGPSFATGNVLREYSLDVDLFLRIYGKTHRIRFEHNELILLPHEIHLMGV